MKITETITVTDRATLHAAIKPFTLPLSNGGVLVSKILKKEIRKDKETYFVECLTTSNRKETKQVYQIEFHKTV